MTIELGLDKFCNALCQFVKEDRPTRRAAGSRQRRAEAARCHAHLAAEDRVEMALVGEAGLLCNQGERLVGPAQQGLCTLEPTLDDIALRPNPGRLLERGLK